MTTITTLLCVTDSGYWITEPTAHVEGLQTGGGNGLIWPGRGAATIATGLEDGPVRITVDARATEPPLDLEDWEEVIEVSIQFDTDEADLESLGGTVDEDPQETPLCAVGPGWYRVRLHARGRDRAAEIADLELDEEPVEEHLIQTWPAPQAPEIRHKMTDAYGAERRTR